MPLEAIKQAIFARNTDAAQFLYAKLKRNPDGEFADRQDAIIFVAYPGSDQVLQFWLRASTGGKLHLELKAWGELYDWGKAQDSAIRRTEDFEPTLENIRSYLSKAQKNIAKILPGKSFLKPNQKER